MSRKDSTKKKNLEIVFIQCLCSEIAQLYKKTQAPETWTLRGVFQLNMSGLRAQGHKKAQGL